MEYIRVAIPPEGTDLKEFFDRQLSNSEFRRVLDLDVDEFDERAVHYGTEIDTVEADEDGVTVFYEVFWDAYHGCKDINHAGSADREVFGEVDGSDWLFQVYQAPEKRSTFEEY